jgi:hypothetical protein
MTCVILNVFVPLVRPHPDPQFCLSSPPSMGRLTGRACYCIGCGRLPINCHAFFSRHLQYAVRCLLVALNRSTHVQHPQPLAIGKVW